MLSPVIFVLYVSDLEDWLMHSSAFTYADDTSTSVSDNLSQLSPFNKYHSIVKFNPHDLINLNQNMIVLTLINFYHYVTDNHIKVFVLKIFDEINTLTFTSAYYYPTLK